jgi:hypothetical protein
VFNPLPTNGNKSPKPPLAHPGALPDPEGVKQPTLPGTPYEPYSEKPAMPEPPYVPYAEKPAPHEQFRRRRRMPNNLA